MYVRGHTNEYFPLHSFLVLHSMLLENPHIISDALGSKWPQFVSFHYWCAPRGARGVKKSGQPNWSPCWWVGGLRFSQNWRNCEKPSKLNKNCQKKTCFLKVYPILFKLGWTLALKLTKGIFSLDFLIFWHPGPGTPGGVSIVDISLFWDLFLIFLKPLKN